MKRNLLFFLFFVVCLALCSGCSYLRSGMVSLSKEDLANAEAMRTTAGNLLSTWKMNSGFIRGALGDKINQFPAEVVKAMAELDALAEKKDLNDFDLGYSLGTRVRLMGAMIQNVVKQYAPEVLQYFPIAF